MRAKAVSIANPRTEAKVSQRIKFALALRFLHPCLDFICTGYRNYATKQTALNAGMSYILTNATTGSYPDFRILPARVLVSRGSLTAPANVQSGISSGEIKIFWEDNSETGSAKKTDIALAIAINPANGKLVCQTKIVVRIMGVEAFPVPTD